MAVVVATDVVKVRFPVDMEASFLVAVAETKVTVVFDDRPKLIGYAQHVHVELLDAAREDHFYDQVLTRGQFDRNVASIVAGVAHSRPWIGSIGHGNAKLEGTETRSGFRLRLKESAFFRLPPYWP